MTRREIIPSLTGNLGSFMTILLIPALAIPRDPGVYLAGGMTWLSLQMLVWVIARDSTDTNWWRSAALGGLIGVTSVILMFMGAQSGGVWLGLVFAAIVAWFAIGFLYDMEIWQRIVVSVAGPLLGIGSFYAGFALRDVILDALGRSA